MTIGSLYNADNVVVGQAACLFAPGGTAPPLPSGLTTTDPFLITPWTSASTSWKPCGATDQGWTWASAKTITDIYIEEQSSLVDRTIENQQLTVTAALSEDIMQTLALVYNLTVATTASSSGYPQINVGTPSDNPISYAVGLIMANADSLPRYLYIPYATVLANVSTPLRRAAAKRMYTAEFSSISNITAVQLVELGTPPAA
jgi:hypothetical protein